MFLFGLLLGFPLVAQLIHKRSRVAWLSPVLLCYAAGICWANFSSNANATAIAEEVSHISILLSLPLLLAGTDLQAFLKQAKGILAAFFLCVLSGLLITLVAGFLFRDQLSDIWIYCGMLVGVYTGGTPNMNLVGLALQAPGEAFIYLNGADIITGGLFLFFLLSVGSSLYGTFLRKKESPTTSSQVFVQQEGMQLSMPAILSALGFAVLIACLSAGITFLITDSLEAIGLLLLLLTSLSIGASFLPGIRKQRNFSRLGDYFLLVFSVAIGSLANFSNFESEALPVVLLTAFVLLSAAFLHILLCRFSGIDRDTAMITATAAFYGPPFVPQVADVIQNRGMILPGVICGLAGYAIGNYLGIGMGHFIQILIGQ